MAAENATAILCLLFLGQPKALINCCQRPMVEH